MAKLDLTPVKKLDLTPVKKLDLKPVKPSIPERLFTPISKQLTGKTLGERTRFLEKKSQQLVEQADIAGRTPSTAEFFIKQLPAATAQAGVELADLSPFDIGLVAATAGAARIPVLGTTIGRIATKVPLKKGFVKSVKELGRLDRTLKAIAPLSARAPIKKIPKFIAKERPIVSATQGPSVYGTDGRIIKHAARPEIHPSLDKILPEKIITEVEKRAVALEAQRRGLIPFDLQQKLGAKIKITQADFDNINPGDVANAERLRALRGNLIEQLGQMGDDTNLKNLFMTNVQKVFGLQSETGRALGSLSDDVVIANDEMKFLTNSLRNLDPDVKGAAERLLRQFKAPGFWDMFMEYRTAALLTSPFTHERNITGNLIGRLFTIPEKIIAGGVNAIESKLRGTPREKYVREGIADAVGMVRGMGPALREGLKALTSEEYISNSRIFEAVRFRKSIPGAAGKVVRLPFRALNAMDEFFSTLNKTGSLYSQATNQALREGAKNVSLRVAQLIKDPTPEMIAKASQESLYQTFRQPLGKTGKFFQKGIFSSNVARFIIPFFRTPVNLFKWSFQRSPAGLISPSNWKAIAKGTPSQRADATARMAFGQVLSAGMALAAWTGHLTGRLSGDWRKKQALMRQGIQPYSIKIGNKYISYRSFEPVSSWFGLVANTVEIAKEEKKLDENKIAIIIGETAKMMKDQSFLRGISDVLKGLDDPDRHGERLIQNMSASLIPTGVGYLARLADPVLREKESIPDSIRAKLPYFSKDLPPKLDVWGRPITREGSLMQRALLPTGVMTEKPDLVESELLALDFYPQKINKTYRGLPLTIQERNMITVVEGRVAKVLLDQTVATREYKNMTPQEQDEFLHKVVTEARKAARRGLFGAQGKLTIIKLRELKTLEEKLQLLEKVTRKTLYKR